MKNIRKLLSVLLAAMLLLTLVSGVALAEGGDKVTITVNTQSGLGAEEAWKAVADAYMAIHPEVEIVIDLKPTDNYGEWLQNVYATENPTTDIVNINLAGAIAVGNSINWLEYAYNDSPYSDGIWADQFNIDAQSIDKARGEMTALSLDSVQVIWCYNKNIFEEVGVEPPTTWDEFVAVCEKLDAAGYQPLAVAGDYESFWSGKLGWLAQIYADQTTRSMINVYRAQEGDWCYDPDMDGTWEYDPTDPYNDDPWNVNQNDVRVWKAMVEGEYTADTPGMRTVWTNLAKIFPKYAGGDNFFGTNDSQISSIFYQQKAAIILDGAWRIGQFKTQMEQLTSGEDLELTEDNVISAEGITPFEMGTFNMPSMEGEGIEAPARTIEVANGFLGAIKKDKAHDDAVADFLMYLSSAEGYTQYLTAGYDAGMTINGSTLVYGAELPGDVQSMFDSLTFIGNVQKGNGVRLARGLAGSAGDITESYRLFYDYCYRYLTGEIDIEQWITEHCANIEQYLPEAMTTSGVSMTDIENPQNAPTGQ